MVDKLLLALNSGVCDLAYLVRVELAPLPPMKLVIERYNVSGVSEINESISHVALILEVNRQVQEVKLAFVIILKGSLQHLCTVLVGNVPDHERSSGIAS